MYNEYGYQLERNLIPIEIAKLLNWQFRDMIKNNYPKITKEKDQVPGAWSSYGNYNADLLLFLLKPKIEKVVNLELVPTYSYYRLYEKGQELKPHTDRKSCEYSVTINLGYSHDWPLYIEDYNSFTHEMFMGVGDGIIYNGTDLKHHREKFDGDWYSQIFLHYVDIDGPNRNYIYDKRDILW